GFAIRQRFELYPQIFAQSGKLLRQARSLGSLLSCRAHNVTACTARCGCAGKPDGGETIRQRAADPARADSDSSTPNQWRCRLLTDMVGWGDADGHLGPETSMATRARLTSCPDFRLPLIGEIGHRPAFPAVILSLLFHRGVTLFLP